jgi:serine/threonine protein kinase
MAPETYNTAVQSVGDYDLLDKIADGGMGTVFKGKHRQSGQVVAIKLLASHLAKNPTYLQRFEKEYLAVRDLNHPNIVAALAQGVCSGRPYLVMEFVDGESLGDRLEREGRLSESEAIRIIVQAARGLQRAHHQGLVHRDIKPDNIMLAADGTVKLADFGLVKELEADLNLTRTSRGLGTPHFMAPEQFRNAKYADARCDIYSLGATLYMMVTGKMPFAACAPLDAWMKKVNNDLVPARTIVPDLSEQVNGAIHRAMDPEPADRPASCQEFIDDLTTTTPRKFPVKIKEAPGNELWYLQYRDEQGKLHMVKGKMSGIRRSLKEGRLGDASNVVVCRTKTGSFGPLKRYPEFRDLIAHARPTSSSRRDTPPSPLNLPSTATDSAMDGSDDPISLRDTQLPLIPLPTTRSHTLEWVKLSALVAVAVGAGVLAALLFPK